jgi:hypothetical protein
MVFVVAQLIKNVHEQKETARNANGKAGNVDGRVPFVFK